MRKYYLSIAVLALFAIGFSASDEESSSSENKTEETEQQVQETKQQPKKNPLENFVGTYNLYDDNGNTGETITVSDDGRFFREEYDGSKVYCGRIGVISDNVFSLYPMDYIYIFSGGDVASYKNGKRYSNSRGDIKMKTIVFDISEKKMYVDKDEYDNRDYTSPEYYKFKFTKK